MKKFVVLVALLGLVGCMKTGENDAARVAKKSQEYLPPVVVAARKMVKNRLNYPDGAIFDSDSPSVDKDGEWTVSGHVTTTSPYNVITYVWTVRLKLRKIGLDENDFNSWDQVEKVELKGIRSYAIK